jgi:DNA-binding NtrC family response regulator
MSKIILIVDDNEPTRQMLSSVVESAGYTPMVAENGEEGLKIAQEHKISCALIDQYMEPMDGFTLARYFQLHEIKMPMIMITGNDNSDLLSQARKLDFLTTMTKPIDTDHLLKLLERFTR